MLVKLISGDQAGWGETSPWQDPANSPEWCAWVFSLLRDHLAPCLLCKRIESGEQLADEMKAVKGNPFAKAGLDLAWWDLYARHTNQPLWQAIGGTGREVAVGADFWVMETIDALLAKIDEAIQNGFKQVKLKYRPGWGLEMIATMRQAFPHIVFHADCNSAYTLKNAGMIAA